MSNTFKETAEAVMEKEKKEKRKKNEKPTYMGEDGLLYCATATQGCRRGLKYAARRVW